jgi:hypothetical protein
MRKIDYDSKEKYTGNAENVIAADETIENKFGNVQRAYNEGFAAADGVRGGTAETDGRIEHPEKTDDSHPSRVPESIENENPGLADN